VFKNKGFLYGLGLGLILGASLLQLMNFAVIKGKGIDNTVSTASPMPSATVKPSATPIASLRSPQPSAVNRPNSPNTATPAAPTSVKPEVNKTDVPATPKPAGSAVVSSKVDVIIEEGMNSSQVADLLFNKGVITDRTVFDDALGHLKLDRTIHYGTYTFNPNENIPDIINKITWQKR
jgi:hypothetical protein